MTTHINPAIEKAMQSVNAAIARADADPTRPVYHFRPPALWMNDPNGPIYHNGWFHLFYQFNPYGDEWGHMHWGHARSRDWVHWEHLPIALWPSLEQGEEHVFSGCAWHNGDGTPLLFYTSVKSGPKESRPPNEQWAARPLDEGLLTWEKHPDNPVLALATHGGPAFDREWRDPFIFEESGRTFMVVGGDYDNVAGIALYEAVDSTLMHWRYHKLLYQAPRDQKRFLECPNFFKVDGKWILIASPYNLLEYVVGSFDVDTLTFTPEQEGILDPGKDDVPNFYASNILFDQANRCVLMGWVRGFASERGWNGALTLPRILTIGDDGHPRQQPHPELEQLRGRLTNFGVQYVYGYGELSQSFPNASLEIDAVVKLSGKSEAGIRLNGKRLVRYETSGRLTVAGTEVALPLGANGKLSLRIFIDRSVLEVFANDGQVAVTRLIDVTPGRCDLQVYADGQSCQVERLKAWEMKSIWE
ncbi:MAG: glycoside hydrolase family 32 protein [Caldilineaceae bacterium]